MAINVAALKEMLQPGLMKVQGEYKDVAPEWKDVFTTRMSKMQLERILQTRMVGMAAVQREGSAPVADNRSGARWVVNMETKQAGIQYTMTRLAIDDGLYKTEFRPLNLELNKGMRAFWNMDAANIFNNADTYDSATGGDGQPLLSTAHPIDGGTFANTTSTPLALNETSLFTAYENVYNGLLNQAGMKVDATGESLVVPAHLEGVARRLQNAVLRPGMATNDPNELGNVGGAAKRIRVMRYLTNRFEWFVTTDVPGLWHLSRVPYETRMWHDDATQNLSVANYERAGFFCSDPRAVVGYLATA
jgi:hypothetical protein